MKTQLTSLLAKAELALTKATKHFNNVCDGRVKGLTVSQSTKAQTDMMALQQVVRDLESALHNLSLLD